MDFFPSESESLKASVSPNAAAQAPVTRSDTKPAEAWPQRPKTTGVPSLDLDVTHLNLNVTQAMKEVQDLGVALGQLRAMAGELAEKYGALQQTYGAADQRSQDIETAFARIDSLAQMRLAQLSNASDLATRTEKILARLELSSAETDRQLAAITEARNLLGRDLAHAKAAAPSRADAPAARRTAVDRLKSHRVRLGAVVAAIAEIYKTIARPSRRAVVAVALVALAVAVVGIIATWSDGNANGVGVPIVESRVVMASGLPLPELPRRLTPTVHVVPQPSVAVRSSNRKAANPAPPPAAGFVGQLAIESSPPGATVFIDGKPVGETPMSSVRIRAGSHAISIELPKYRRWTAAVRVPAGRTTRVNATLQIAPNR